MKKGARLASIAGARPIHARLSACIGGIVWLALLAIALPESGPTAWIIRALHLSILVLIPLGLSLVAPTTREDRTAGLYRVAIWLQPVAAWLGVLAFWRAPGVGAAALATPWFVWTAIIALYGGARLLYGRRSAEEICLSVGMFLLPVGGGWLLINRGGLHPGGYGSTLTLLIALHYHYAGYTAPLLTGLAGQQLAIYPARPSIRQVFRAVAVGACVGSPVIAVGASSTPLIEVVAVALLACSLVGLALLMLRYIVPRTELLLVRALLVVSSCALLFSMLLAIIYAVGNAIGRPLLTIAQMARIHGTANAVGFALCGLLAWTIYPARPVAAPPVQASSAHADG